jgi:alanine-glyoxylate transaminase/(R)-3-amino-2-methylpropionate-pyruvate transaminase
VACFIGEPIQGVGGAVTPPTGILPDRLRHRPPPTAGCAWPTKCRPGSAAPAPKFWGFENWGVTPDIVTMAKGIGNGIPLGNCITRPEIAATVKNRIHFNTYRWESRSQ